MGQYAAKTSVGTDRSRGEIERTLERWGADNFAYGKTAEKAMIAFTFEGRQVRFTVPMPNRNDKEFTRTDTGRVRTESAATEAWQQATRQQWRALALVIKAKLAAVESGIVTFEQEFLPHVVMPDGRTVAEHVIPAVAEAYRLTTVPPLLQIEST